MKKYDAVIIGFGKGGKTLAGKLAGEGKEVALIEKSNKMYGGTCINVGCIPSKSLVRGSQITLSKGALSFEEKARLYADSITEKRRVTSMLRKKNYDKLDQLSNVTVYDGTASFISNTKIKIDPADDGDSFVIEGGNIFINTGASTVIPPIKGLKESNHIYYSDTLMDLDRLPKKLVIIGGGYIGLEFASMYAGFGSEVTVIEGMPRLIPREDEDIALEIQKALEEKGVRFLTGAAVDAITKSGENSKVEYTVSGVQNHLEADAILVATGRKPNTEGLNAAAAGVELTDRGAIKVDEGNKTTAPNIWAMGDVAGGLQFTYVSLDDYRIVWSQLHNGDYDARNVKRKNVPYSVFIDPPFSRVGINEQEAAKAGIEVKIAKLPEAAIPKAQVLNKTNGLLKAVIDAKNGKILGAMLFCEESYEMINIVKLAMDMDVDYTVLRDQIYTHPIMSESLNDLFDI